MLLQPSTGLRLMTNIIASFCNSNSSSFVNWNPCYRSAIIEAINVAPDTKSITTSLNKASNQLFDSLAAEITNDGLNIKSNSNTDSSSSISTKIALAACSNASSNNSVANKQGHPPTLRSLR